MNINTKSVLLGMQTVLPYFKERKAGQVINVSSLLARLPFNAPIRAMYSASKAAVNSLTCSARTDIHAEGFHDIQVSLYSPGVVATEFELHAVHGGPDNRTVPYAQSVQEIGEQLVALMESKQADVYSKDAYHRAVSEYYSCNDVEAIDSKGAIGYEVPKGKEGN
jgi:NADP-dependent 3-hydroxy acid dehydrogenase YdfG